VVLIEADPRGEREVRAPAYKHPSPARVAHVEVKLIHPALLVLQVGAVVVPICDGHQDARRFPRFHDRHHWVGLGILEIRVQEPVAPAVIARAIGGFENRCTPFLRTILQPILKLVGALGQGLSGHPLSCALGVEEPEHALGWLERLNQAVEQQPVKAAVGELDAMLRVRDEGVHGALLWGEIPGEYRHERLRFYGRFAASTEVSGPAGLAEGARLRAGGIQAHRDVPQV